jgi:hypothetical protein
MTLGFFCTGAGLLEMGVSGLILYVCTLGQLPDLVTIPVGVLMVVFLFVGFFSTTIGLGILATSIDDKV